MNRQTHAQNVAKMARKSTRASKISTVMDQQVDELLRVLRLASTGRAEHFRQFSAQHLTAKGESLALAIVGDDRSAAASALRAGY